MIQNIICLPPCFLGLCSLAMWLISTLLPRTNASDSPTFGGLSSRSLRARPLASLGPWHRCGKTFTHPAGGLSSQRCSLLLIDLPPPPSPHSASSRAHVNVHRHLGRRRRASACETVSQRVRLGGAVHSKILIPGNDRSFTFLCVPQSN